MEEELEKEIQRYNEEQGGDCRYVQTARHFARWMREQMMKELSEKIAAAYQLGLSDKEKQMMKEAVEGEIINAGYPTKIELNTFYSKFEHGQEVKLIIIKEDKQ